jgi:4-amino-4-deoxychorismate lyase
MPVPVLLLLSRPSLDAEPLVAGAPPHASVDSRVAHINVLDLGVTRGDGIFETISVAAGHPQALEPHLARFARSAAMLDLPAPDPEAWRAAIHAAIAEHEPVAEGLLKTILTRGIEGGSSPTGWIYMEQSGDFRAAREQGIRVVTLDRGYASTVPVHAPWLLQGAKTLSYAVNRAALREAARRGADDVVFTTSDGFLLEGPTSTLVLRSGARLRTPPSEFGILEGTTQASVFAFAESRGMATSVEPLTPADLAEADAAWLMSSVRHAAPIRELDGTPRAVDAALTRDINAYLMARVD